VVSIYTATFNNNKFCPTQLYLCVLCGSENKQRLFPYTALTDCLVEQRRSVFTARYGLDVYIKLMFSIRLVQVFVMA